MKLYLESDVERIIEEQRYELTRRGVMMLICGAAGMWAFSYVNHQVLPPGSDKGFFLAAMLNMFMALGQLGSLMSHRTALSKLDAECAFTAVETREVRYVTWETHRSYHNLISSVVVGSGLLSLYWLSNHAPRSGLGYSAVLMAVALVSLLLAFQEAKWLRVWQTELAGMR